MSPVDLMILKAISPIQTLIAQFKACLLQEAAVLAQWPPQGLWPIQEEKVRLVRDLEAAHIPLANIIRAQGQDLNRPTTLGADVMPVWQALREDLAACQQLNATHEQCLAKQQVALKQSLELLILKIDQDVTYGRQGSCQGGRRLGTIGRA
jgi:flagellar biosynthesis/type III secretory pathway chaperone